MGDGKKPRWSCDISMRDRRQVAHVLAKKTLLPQQFVKPHCIRDAFRPIRYKHWSKGKSAEESHELPVAIYVRVPPTIFPHSREGKAKFGIREFADVDHLHVTLEEITQNARPD